MDKLSASIVFGSLILAGVSVMFSLPPLVGLGIIALAFIWGLLTIPKWGPLRKYWDSKPARIFLIEYVGHTIRLPKQEGGVLGIMVEVGFYIAPTMLIKSVKLQLQDEFLPSDWRPCSIGGAPEKRMVHFSIPERIKPRVYTVKVVAFANGIKRESNSFPITLPGHERIA